MNKDLITADATVIKCARGRFYLVELANGHRLTAYISAHLGSHNIRCIPGDRVQIEISPLGDFSNGRIIHRYRD